MRLNHKIHTSIELFGCAFSFESREWTSASRPCCTSVSWAYFIYIKKTNIAIRTQAEVHNKTKHISAASMLRLLSKWRQHAYRRVFVYRGVKGLGIDRTYTYIFCCPASLCVVRAQSSLLESSFRHKRHCILRFCLFSICA